VKPSKAKVELSARTDLRQDPKLYRATSTTRVPPTTEDGKTKLDSKGNVQRGGKNVLTPERKAVLTFLKKLFKDFQMCVVRVLVSYLFSLVDCSRAGTNSLDKVSQSDVQEMTGRLITVFHLPNLLKRRC
jgi:hypothetical protein